jgi:hypothetical protein
MSIVGRLNLAIVVLLTVPRLASAQSAGEEPETLIRQGNELRRQGQDARAYGYFERAYELSHTARTAAQFGIASLAVNKLLEAEALLADALAKDDPWVEANRPQLETSLATTHKRLGRVSITGTPPRTTVQAPKRRAQELPRDGVLWVIPGENALEIVAPGRPAITRTVTVAAGESTTLDLAPLFAGGAVVPPRSGADEHPPEGQDGAGGSTSSNDQPPPGAEPRIWTTRKKVGVALGATGVAALAVGVTFHILRESRAGAFNDDGCHSFDNMITGPADCQSRYDGVQTARNLAIAGYAGAALLGAAGAILFFTGGGSSSSGASSATTAAVDHGLTWQCTPTPAGVACAGRF